MEHGPNRVLTPLKSASFEIRITSFVPRSKIFVWEDTFVEMFKMEIVEK
jgi:hypothetical protein